MKNRGIARMGELRVFWMEDCSEGEDNQDGIMLRMEGQLKWGLTRNKRISRMGEWKVS